MDIETFTNMVKSHDLTYGYSDDPRWYRLGSQSYAAIEAAAKKIDRAEAVRIWNENVAKKLSIPAASHFLWKE